MNDVGPMAGSPGPHRAAPCDIIPRCALELFLAVLSVAVGMSLVFSDDFQRTLYYVALPWWPVKVVFWYWEVPLILAGAAQGGAAILEAARPVRRLISALATIAWILFLSALLATNISASGAATSAVTCAGEVYLFLLFRRDH